MPNDGFDLDQVIPFLDQFEATSLCGMGVAKSIQMLCLAAYTDDSDLACKYGSRLSSDLRRLRPYLDSPIAKQLADSNDYPIEVCGMKWSSYLFAAHTIGVGLIKEIGDAANIKWSFPDWYNDADEIPGVKMMDNPQKIGELLDAVDVDIPPDGIAENWPKIREYLNGIDKTGLDELSLHVQKEVVRARKDIRSETSDPLRHDGKQVRYKPPPCPKCDGQSGIQKTQATVRYLKCKNEGCQHTWILPRDDI